ncbi:hypothetical protein [Acinetobacter sp. YH12025]|uniref:hypothetical protein n=1 Tax=Acinetobacter sp. YH12025 TaxID=2601042 RepID=UPI0015D2C7C7|nr:hypothetical protein [Acinetobacter sp. YH12025]
MTNVEKYISTYVDIEIEIDDVLEFIGSAEEDEKDRILVALGRHNECGQLVEMDTETLKYLIDQANKFGIDDMLYQLKCEGMRVGAYLNPKAVVE